MPDRIEREIEEILKKIDNLTPESGGRRPRRGAGPALVAQRWLAQRLAALTMAKIALWSLLIVVGAYVFRFANPVLMRWLIVGGLIVFFTALVLSSRNSQRPRTERRWRGEVLDLSGPSWPEKLRDWLKGRRRP